MMKYAVIYARQSSGSDDYSESVEVQIANCRKLAEQHDLQIVEICSDLNVSGKTYPAGWETLAAADRAFQHWFATQSGTRQFREGLGRVMRLLEVADFVIVDDITRLYRPLSRSYLEAAVNQKLIENKVRILQVKGGQLDLAQFDQQLITMLKNQINDEQIAKQRLRSIEVLNKLRDSGVMPTGVSAFGLCYHKASKTFTVEADKIVVVKYIFEQIRLMTPYNCIVKVINQRWKHFFRGCFWEKNLYSIARKPIYAGYQYNTAGQLIANQQGPAVISLSEFMEVQKIMELKRLHSGRSRCNAAGCQRHWLPLSGFLYCGICGSRLVAAIEKERVFYVCRRGYLQGNLLCRRSRIAVEVPKDNLIGLRLLLQRTFKYALALRCRRLQNLEAVIADSAGFYQEITALRKRLQIVNEQFVDGVLPEDIFRADTRTLSAEIQACQQQILTAELRGADGIDAERRELMFWQQKLEKGRLSHREYEILLQESVSRVVIYDQKVEIYVGEKIFAVKRHRSGRQKGFTVDAGRKLKTEIGALCDL